MQQGYRLSWEESYSAHVSLSEHPTKHRLSRKQRQVVTRNYIYLTVDSDGRFCLPKTIGRIAEVDAHVGLGHVGYGQIHGHVVAVPFVGQDMPRPANTNYNLRQNNRKCEVKREGDAARRRAPAGRRVGNRHTLLLCGWSMRRSPGALR